jgi:hypothetical protein
MESLLIFLTVGAIMACIFGMIRGDNAGEFLMRLVFMEAMQVLFWYITQGKDLM